MAPKFGRVVIYTKKIDQMADFYSTHFGFSVSPNPDDRIVELKQASSDFSLMLHPAAKSQKEGQALVKFVFDIEDVAAFCNAAGERGLKFGKIHRADRYEFANAKDPSNNSVQISSRAFVKE